MWIKLPLMKIVTQKLISSIYIHFVTLSATITLPCNIISYCLHLMPSVEWEILSVYFCYEPAVIAWIKHTSVWQRCPPLLTSQAYFNDKWNVFDFSVVLGSVLDIAYSKLEVCGRGSGGDAGLNSLLSKCCFTECQLDKPNRKQILLQ